MSHYKSNLRDIEFNLFEVLGPGPGPGHRPVRGVRRRDRARDPRRGRADQPRGPGRVVRGQRPQPAGVRPEGQHRAAARVVQEELPGLDGRRVLAAADPRVDGRPARSVVAQLGDRRAGARRQRPHLDVRRRPVVGQRDRRATAPSATSGSPSSWSSKGWGATMVLTEPDAGSDVGAGRTKATANDDGSWNIEGVKRFITSRRVRPAGERHPPGARPPGRASTASAVRAPRA